jgi:hypothetical protein
MKELRIATFVLIPWHERKALVWLPLIEARNVAQDKHPPMIRLNFFTAANVACEGDIPNHDSPHLPKEHSLLSGFRIRTEMKPYRATVRVSAGQQNYSFCH